MIPSARAAVCSTLRVGLPREPSGEPRTEEAFAVDAAVDVATLRQAVELAVDYRQFDVALSDDGDAAATAILYVVHAVPL